MYKARFGDKVTIYEPWEFKHMEDYKVKRTKSTQKYGVPKRSSSASQCFDMAGMVKKFELTIYRVDSEESISNWDFLFTKNIRYNGKFYKGLDYFLAILQTTHPYQLQIYWEADSNQESDPMTRKTGKYNVSLESYNWEFLQNEMGTLKVTLNLVERRA